MPSYAIRITAPFADLSGIIELWSTKCKGLVVVQHEADEDISQTHVHLALHDCEYATVEPLKRSFRKFTTKYDNVKGNTLWSFKIWDGSTKYYVYMFKGSLLPVYNNILTQELIQQYQSNWVQPAPNATPTNSSVTKWVVVKMVYEYFENKCPIRVDGKRDVSLIKQVSDEDILRCIRSILLENQMALGLYKVMDIYDSFIMYANKEKFIANCLQVLEKRLPRV